MGSSLEELLMLVHSLVMMKRIQWPNVWLVVVHLSAVRYAFNNEEIRSALERSQLAMCPMETDIQI